MRVNRLLFPCSLLIASLLWRGFSRPRTGRRHRPPECGDLPGDRHSSNSNTKMATVRTTDESGRYLFDFIEPGTYTFTAKVPGLANS